VAVSTLAIINRASIYADSVCTSSHACIPTSIPRHPHRRPCIPNCMPLASNAAHLDRSTHFTPTAEISPALRSDPPVRQSHSHGHLCLSPLLLIPSCNPFAFYECISDFCRCRDRCSAGVSTKMHIRALDRRGAAQCICAVRVWARSKNQSFAAYFSADRLPHTNQRDDIQSPQSGRGGRQKAGQRIEVRATHAGSKGIQSCRCP